MDYWNLGYLALRAVVFVLTCLTLGMALSRARVHAAWLLPSCIGQGLLLCSYLLFVVYKLSLKTFSSTNSQFLMQMPQQILLGLSMLCAVWAAVALYQTMRTLTVGVQVNGRGQYPPMEAEKDVWPPPPRQ